MPQFYDEMYSGPGVPRPHYAGFARWMDATPPEVIERKRVEADLAFHRADMSYGSEPGAFRLWVGPSSAEGQETGFELVD